MNPGAGFVLPVDKPVGPTSHDVVAQARRALGIRRVGHTGTLDPFASGLLLLCVGPATRVAEYLSALPKTYEAVARLGRTTDTLDVDGATVSESDAWRDLDADDVERGVAALRGPIEQVPPQFSAKKVDGVAMHRRARRGEHVDLPAQSVVVHELSILGWNAPDLAFRVRCSSGTYIRSMARDIGAALGCGAHLTSLRRTVVGDVGVERSVTVADLVEPGSVEAVALDPLDALAHLTRMDIGADDATELRHGRPLSRSRTEELAGVVEGTTPIAIALESRLVAIGACRDGRLWPSKVFQGD